MCRHRDTVCDDIVESGCPEDDEWSAGPGFKCLRNGKTCRLPQQLLYDNVKDCELGEDLCFRHSVEYVRSFYQDSGSSLRPNIEKLV